MRRVRRVLCWLNAGGLAYCWAVHLSTFLVVHPGHDGLGLLAFLAVPLGASGFAAAMHRTDPADRWLRHAPWWLVGLWAALLAYLAAVSFYTDELFRTYHGQPQPRDGGYALVEHGRVLRAIPEEEYRRLLTYGARKWALFGMVWSAVGVSVLAISVRRAHRRAAARPQRPDGGLGPEHKAAAEPGAAADRAGTG